jgi:hypothetical protein
VDVESGAAPGAAGAKRVAHGFDAGLLDALPSPKMGGPMRNLSMARVLCPALLLFAAHSALADDLVSSVLPLSRSTKVGQAVTAFATVINTSGRDLSGCSVSLPGFPGTLAYQTTNPATNAVTGSSNNPFSVSNGASQSLVVALVPQAAISPTEEHLVFQCSGSSPAVSIQGVNTLLLSAEATQPADVVALAATTTQDGILHLDGTNPQAFAVASINLGAAASMTISADWGDINLPISLLVCQTDPSTGNCLGAPASTVSISLNTNATPTFGFFANANAPVPFFPALVRAFVRFRDSGGAIRGSTSIALSAVDLAPVSATAGGFYRGVFRITSGPFIGRFGVTDFLISEDGELRGVTFANATINSIFSGTALIDNQFSYATAGIVAAAFGTTLDNGATVSPLAAIGAVSPHNFLAGLYGVNGETGSFYAQYDASIYERPSSLAAVAGAWRIRNLQGAAVGSLQIAADGSFSGADLAGCAYNGSVSVIDPRYNAYRVNLNVGNCGIATGAYEGLAGLLSTLSTNDTFQFALSGANFGEVNAITRF